MTRVGVITTPLTSGHAVRGVGFYTKHLLEHLKPLAAKHDFELLKIGNYLEIENCKLKIIHYPFFDLFQPTLKTFPDTKTVVTIHDVIPLEFPDHYPPGIRGWINLQLQKYGLSSADRVITDSHASVQTIRRYLSVPHEKIKLVYLAPNPIYKKISMPKNKYKLPKKFILYIGDINYNKNIPTLVKASRLANLPLVIVGKQAKELENMNLSHPELSHLKNTDFSSVIRLGFIPDSDLVHIYNLATVYCQPSLTEGSALTILDALACDTPVACSNIQVFHEHADTAATYFDPYNVKSIATALNEAKPANGPAQVAKFRWEKTAAETIQVYQELI